MSKTKSVAKKGSEKPVDKSLGKVKDAGVTKAAQSPKAKSKQIAREVVAKEEKSKRKKKEPTPSSSSESESESDSDSSSSSESEDEKPAKKEVKKPAKKQAESSSESDSSDEEMKDASSSESDSESEEEKKPAKSVKANPKPSKKAESSDSESSDSDSDSSSEEKAPKAAAKAAAAESSDSDDSDSDSEEEAPAKGKKASKEDSDSGSSDSSDSDSSDSESDSEESDESAKDSKKRKAEEEPAAVSKKSKTEESAEGASANLFVGNLSWNVTEEWLQQEFETFGELSGVRIMTERDTGRSRGFGYVEFASAADAAKAYESMKDTEIDGRKINLDYATGRPANKDQGGFKERAQTRARSFGDQSSPESDTLFIGNLPFSATEDSVHEVFGSSGNVLGIRLPTHQESGQPKGFGYVQYSSVDEARQAFNDLQGAEIDGRPVRLDFSTPRANNGGDRGGRGGGRGGFGGRGGGRGGPRGGGGRGGRGGFGGRGGGAGGPPNRARGGITEFKGTKVTF
ncbi:Putative Nuclear localization sequence binding protein [Aspergillus calidoustus]|uniref:Putative Nuclear localization sequence binding protein n=1 Tax=Aspergillus calidoustus TaxID=454130 RepID=A0A0U5CDW0_ASPCI|nr:Putative Nuclear localization sequence binding protein [Aspergillus calidoustus]